MTKRQQKRRYRNSLAFVESGLTACVGNANDLLAGATSLLKSGLHAPALSLSILTLEELGKACFIDGLLYARPDHQKSEDFVKGTRSHHGKLRVVHLLPLLIAAIAREDMRYNQEQRFNQTIAIVAQNFQTAKNDVLRLANISLLSELDGWKQSGFYSAPQNNGFVKPAEAVEKPIAESVHKLAAVAVDGLNFVFKPDNIQRYIATARKCRSVLSEPDHTAIEEQAELWIRDLFEVNSETDLVD